MNTMELATGFACGINVTDTCPCLLSLAWEHLLTTREFSSFSVLFSFVLAVAFENIFSLEMWKWMKIMQGLCEARAKNMNLDNG